jgi:predicted molibdopterin-dependent oxidoreductase YjgC
VLLLDYPEGFVEINDDDARGFGIRDGDKIRVRGSSGTAVTTARVTREVRSGTIFVPFFVHAVEKQLLGAVLPDMGNLGKPVFVKVEKA